MVMEQLKKLKNLFGKIRKPSDVYYYFQGNTLYWLYVKCNWLLPKYIKEQYHYRLNIMNSKCLLSGQCVICTCNTPMLQLAFKSCDGNCYPRIMNPYKWYRYKQANPSIKKLIKGYI